MYKTEKEWFRVNVFFLACFYVKVALVTAHQCCPPDMSLIEFSKTCSDNKTKYDLECKHGTMFLDPSINENDKFSFDSNRNLLVLDGEELSDDMFCLGKIGRNESGTSLNLVALVCFRNENTSQDLGFISIVLRLLMLVSTFFLLFTLYIYLVLSNLRDIQGKCVIAMICSLIASYVTLFVVQTFPNSSQEACIVQAATLYFFMSSSFFWNNIITFNIWKTVRNASHKIKGKLWFIIYLSWGFGVPFIMVFLSFILEHVPGENHVRPHFGETTCWFRGKVETWSYFYGPISVLLMLNTCMFLHSSWILWKSYKESTLSRIRSLRFKCVMYLRLFLLMGITWVFEVVSYATNDYPHTKYLWFITDCLNCSQGILIFLLLVIFRQKVRLGLLEKKICNIKWPQSWAKEEIQESSELSIIEEVELASQKINIINESQKENSLE